jgi:Zn-dependent M16 (insulinase) family peptidase
MTIFSKVSVREGTDNRFLSKETILNPDNISPGYCSAGFEAISNKDMQEYSSRALHFRHLGTGCEVFHLWNEDPENLFAFAFRTPPQDDTGAAHILEHSVLCGSKRFALKDPFVVLLKSSLQTFLNAFTFPDKTVYPASSMVEKDFFNLMLVTGDAVFFPLLQREVFMQEAHHLEPSGAEEQADGLIRTGVVFNEMKGVFSSPESIVAYASMRSLFPDTPYGFESGGHPRAIASLTHGELRAFHNRFYHPGNCRIFLYGNIPTPRTLEFLEVNFLKSFGPAEIDSHLVLQPRWREPRRVEQTFPMDAVTPENLKKKSSVTLNWLTVPVGDPLKLLSFEVLTEILIGNEGAPLHRALLESKLGHDLSPSSGLETELNELTFSVGLRGTEPESADGIESVVFETLRALVDRGVPEEAVQAALHRVEFRNREIKRGGRPYSLTLMRRAMRGWLHGSDPETTLEFQHWMDVLKAEVAKGGYFERLVEGYLIANPHRTTVVVRPDPDQQKRDEEVEKNELFSLKQAMGREGLRRLQVDLDKLKVFQEQQDSPEILSRIPALHLNDLRREVEKIPTERIDPGPILYHDLYTNGIVYLDLAFDTSGVGEQLRHLLPLFSRALRGSGLPGIPYYDVARKLSLYTGGFGASLSADTKVVSPRDVEERLVLRVKMLEQNVQAAVALVRDLLLSADFQDLERMRTIVLEMRNDLKASLVPAGSHYAALRAGGRVSPALAIEEQWKGISQYIWLDGICRDLQRDLPDLGASLSTLRASLLSRSGLTVNLTCERSILDRIIPVVGDLVSALGHSRPGQGESGDSGASTSVAADNSSAIEILVGSMNVNFVAHAIPGSSFGSVENAHETVLAHFLATGFLWERIRMQGGAYGAGASANGLEALFGFSSYRDPNTLDTLDAFREGLRSAATYEFDRETFEKIVLGAAGKEERPMAPGEKGFVAWKRELLGIQDDQRQARRDALIDCTPEQIAAAAERLLARFDGGITAIVTHPRAVQRDKQRLEKLRAVSVQLPD